MIDIFGRYDNLYREIEQTSYWFEVAKAAPLIFLGELWQTRQSR
jgi:hypothetical protein